MYLPSEMKCTRWNNCPHKRGVLFCRALLCAQKAGSWSDLHAMAFESVRLLLNVFKHAGFCSESCGIGGLCKVEEFPTMNATAMAILAMPSDGIDSLSHPVSEPWQA